MGDNKSRVLGIVGSPREKGNTNAMVDAILQGAAMKGVATEMVQLSQKKIKPCHACDACRSKGKCRHNDDMLDLLTLMKESDVWVFGTPVYWWGPTAQMKAFIDRWYQEIKGLRESGKKKVILAIPYGDTEPDTAKHTIGMFKDAIKYLKKDLSAIIEAPGMLDMTDAEENGELMRRCLKVGKQSVQ